MRKIFFIISIIVSLASFYLISWAANYEFKVLSRSGSVLVQNGKNWNKLQTGAQLSNKDKIMLKPGSQISLMHNSGKSTTLEKSGTYSIQTLSSTVQKQKSLGISKKFSDYVVSQITDAEDLFNEEKHTGKMGTLGAVERALSMETTEDKISRATGTDKTTSSGLSAAASLILSEESRIIPILPRNSYLIDDKVVFSWNKNPKADSYMFQITDSKNKVLYSIATQDTMVIVSASANKIPLGKPCYWGVTSKDMLSSQYCIQWLSESEKIRIENTAEAIKSEFSDKPESLKHLVLAAFYEDENLMPEVISAYTEAIKHAPSMTEYKYLYAKYLTNNGLSSIATEVIK